MVYAGGLFQKKRALPSSHSSFPKSFNFHLFSDSSFVFRLYPLHMETSKWPVLSGRLLCGSDSSGILYTIGGDCGLLCFYYNQAAKSTWKLGGIWNSNQQSAKQSKLSINTLERVSELRQPSLTNSPRYLFVRLQINLVQTGLLHNVVGRKNSSIHSTGGEWIAFFTSVNTVILVVLLFYVVLGAR